MIFINISVDKHDNSFNHHMVFRGFLSSHWPFFVVVVGVPLKSCWLCISTMHAVYKDKTEFWKLSGSVWIPPISLSFLHCERWTQFFYPLAEFFLLKMNRCFNVNFILIAYKWHKWSKHYALDHSKPPLTGGVSISWIYFLKCCSLGTGLSLIILFQPLTTPIIVHFLLSFVEGFCHLKLTFQLLK